MGVTKNAARSKKTATASSDNPNLNARANKFAEDTKPGYLDLLETDQNLTDAIGLLQNVIFLSLNFQQFLRVAKTATAYVKKS
jgi:hypothetical protein